MKFAWLKHWTYTHDVWKQLWSPGTYNESKKNSWTIDFLRANRWIWILPIDNIFWWPVGEVLSSIWTLREAQMLWYVKHKVKHTLAWTWSIEEIKEIHAHPQSFMQCSASLLKMWVDINWFIDKIYRSPEMFDTKEFIIEIDDNKTTLALITKVLMDEWVNIEYLQSVPNGIDKYKFHLLVNDFYKEKLNSKELIEKLTSVWGIIYQWNYKKSTPNYPIKLVKRDNNAAWIPDALNNKRIWVICSEEVAKENGLSILEHNFCPDINETRMALFSTMKEWCIKFEQLPWLIKDRTIWLLSLWNEVGSLNKALEILRKNWLSLSFIMSIANNMWWYDFPIVINREKNWAITNAKSEIENSWMRLRIM